MGASGMSVRSELKFSMRQRLILSSRHAWLKMRSLYQWMLETD